MLVITLFAATLSTRVSIGQTQLLAEMQHTTWAGHDGAPIGIQAVTMGPDGLLYLATMSGVYRFDGNTFEKVQTPSVKFTSTTHNLLFDHAGNLLIMLSHGPPILLRREWAETLDRIDSGAIETITNAQQTPDGSLWAVLNERSLVKLGKDYAWHVMQDPDNGKGHITHLFADASGSLWLVDEDRLYRRPRNGNFMPTNVFVYGRGKFMNDGHTGIWIASAGVATASIPAKHLQHIDAKGLPIPTRDVTEPLAAASPASNDSLWLLTTHSTLIHVAIGALQKGSERLDLNHWKDRLQLHNAVRQDGAYAFFPARDGSLWIGGLGGVEHFQNATLVPLLQNATAGFWEQCSKDKGSQWILSADRTLYERSPDGQMRVRRHGADSLFCSDYGMLASDDDVAGLATLGEAGVSFLPYLPGLKGYGNHYIFTGATTTSGGAIIAAAAGGAVGRSLWEYRSKTWRQLDPGNRNAEISGLAAMPTGEAYLGFRDGTVGILDPEAARVRIIGHAGGKPILGFSRTSKGLIAYGVDGISIVGIGNFRPLLFKETALSAMVTGVAEAADGDLWLNGAKGIVRVPSKEISLSLRDLNHRILANNISEGDFIGPASPNMFAQSAQVGRQGRIWFNTLNGIVSVASDAVRPLAPPPLVIKDILVDGNPLPVNRKLRPGVNTLSIRYIGVDFSDPSGLTYAYKLGGYDNLWQEVGSRTEAVYTHLHAGRYVFSVKARNAFGTWTEPISLEAFVVQPHVYERGWFVALAGLLLAFLSWAAIQLRLRTAAADIRRRADERADERVKIARDLHDTLLQGVQGLLLSFHVAIEGVPLEHESRPSLERALTTAEKLILEGRDRVKGLRQTEISGDELGQLFLAVVEDLGCGDRFHLAIYPTTTERPHLREDVAAELFLVGREAIVNAVRHSNASQITMRLHFASGAFTLDCEDDGVGFDIENQEASKQQHWGISGMRERIETLQGTLRIGSKPRRGTLLRVSLKGKYAYR